jgi:hypothetical protein
MFDLMKKWRWWVVLPLFMVMSVFLLPMILIHIIIITLEKLVDFSRWIDSKLERLYEILIPRAVTRKIESLAKWAKK